MAVFVAGVGYMGAKLVEDLLAQGEQVFAVDNLFSTDRNAIDRFKLHPNFQFFNGDITLPSLFDEVFTSRKDITTVYNLAAQSSAHPEAASSRYTEESNLIGPRVLLDAMNKYGIGNLVYASSFRVYGNTLPAIIDRTTPYGSFADLSHLSKCYVEKLLEMYAVSYDMHCVSLRFGVIYGASPVVKQDPKFMTAPNRFCLQAVQGEPIRVTSTGMATSGFMHVADASRAMQLAARNLDSNRWDFYDAVSELCSVATIASYVQEEARALGLDVKVVLSDAAESNPVEPKLENSVTQIGFNPSRNLRSGVREMLEHFLGHRSSLGG